MTFKIFIPEDISECPLARMIVEHEVEIITNSPALALTGSSDVYVDWNSEEKAKGNLFEYYFHELSSVYTSSSFREADRFSKNWS